MLLPPQMLYTVGIIKAFFILPYSKECKTLLAFTALAYLQEHNYNLSPQKATTFCLLCMQVKHYFKLLLINQG